MVSCPERRKTCEQCEYEQSTNWSSNVHIGGVEGKIPQWGQQVFVQHRTLVVCVEDLEVKRGLEGHVNPPVRFEGMSSHPQRTRVLTWAGSIT